MDAFTFTFTDLGRIDYEKALAIQAAAFDALLDAKKNMRKEENKLFFCEHQPVLTIGKSGKESNLLVSAQLLKDKGIALYHVARGGDITYHGPGQITVYPVFNLEHWKIGLKQYIRILEEIMIRFLDKYGIKGGRFDGASGVWIDPDTPGKARKIGAIGVKSSRFVTMHGFAININTDLNYFSLINPCGFTEKGVTSLAEELGRPQDFAQAKREILELFGIYFPQT